MGMMCRGPGLGPQALHGFTEKTDWVKKLFEVCGICAKFFNNKKYFLFMFLILGGRPDSVSTTSKKSTC